MNKIKEILITLVAIAFTILNIYKVQMPVPVDDHEYTVYANRYLMMTSISFIIICLANMSKYSNWLVESLMMVNIGVYSVLFFKAYFGVAGSHNYYDWTYAGIFVIYAAIHAVRRRSNTKH